MKLSFLQSGTPREGDLPELLAAAAQPNFGGPLDIPGQAQLVCRQVVTRFLANVVDFRIEEGVGNPDEPFAGLDGTEVRRCLDAMVAQHAEIGAQLGLPMSPDLTHAFALEAPRPEFAAFGQCPRPEGAKIVDRERGFRLLGGAGMRVATLLPTDTEAQRFAALCAVLGKQAYSRGHPSSSRPLTQAIALDDPTDPSWRWRNEVFALLRLVHGGDAAPTGEAFGFRGKLRFLWLLEYLPQGAPIRAEHQHPLALDVAMPVRHRHGWIEVFNKPAFTPASDGKGKPKEQALATGAVAERKHWASGCVACLPIRPAGKNSPPTVAAVQRPLGKAPSTGEIVEAIAETLQDDSSQGVPALRTLVDPLLDGLLSRPFALDLVIEGEPITDKGVPPFWLDVRLPTPSPDEDVRSRKEQRQRWVDICRRQLDLRAAAERRLAGALNAAYLAASLKDEATLGKRDRDDARARTATRTGEWRDRLETPFWDIAAKLPAGDNEWRAALRYATRAIIADVVVELGGWTSQRTTAAARKSGFLVNCL